MKNLKQLFTVLLLLCTTVATAHDFVVGGIYYNILSEEDKTVEVTFKGNSSNSYSNEYTGNVVIPESVIYNNVTYSVTSIGVQAFYYCSGLTSITIPNSVTSIEEMAFYYCTGLTSITIPNSVTKIGNNAFRGCNGLESIVVEEGNTKYDSRNNCNAIIETSANTIIAGFKNTIIPSNITSIGYSAFGGCTGLESIEIPNSVTTIGEGAFASCTGLTSVEIPNSVTSIGAEAFAYCNGLTSITIPNSVTSIGDNAFTGTAWYNKQPDGSVYLGKMFYEYKGTMPENTSVTIKEGTLGISANAFINCSGLKSITIPNSVTNIGYQAFAYCTGLTSIEIPNSVTNIEFSAFRECVRLTSITIPNSVTAIGRYAFASCTGLASVTIGNSVTNFGESAFEGCSALTDVHVTDIIAWYNMNFENYNANPLHYGADLYSNEDKITSLVVPENVTEIKKYVFAGCTSIREVTIHSGVTSIGKDAFYGCELTSVTSFIPAEQLFAINRSFYCVEGLGTLYVPYGAKETYAATSGWNVFANIVELDPAEVTITINEYGSATYCSEFALDFSNVEGLKAYAATGYNTATQVVTLTRVQTAKEATGLFLMGEPGEYTVPVIENSNDFTLNLLVGTLESTGVNGTTNDGNYINFKYTIGETSDAPLFYQFEDNSTLSAGKAYLQLPATLFPAAASKSVGVRFDDGTTTDIEDVENAEGETQTVYDLQGRKVENPSNGIYIIDGKKVFVR